MGIGQRTRLNWHFGPRSWQKNCTSIFHKKLRQTVAAMASIVGRENPRRHPRGKNEPRKNECLKSMQICVRECNPPLTPEGLCHFENAVMILLKNSTWNMESMCHPGLPTFVNWLGNVSKKLCVLICQPCGNMHWNVLNNLFCVNYIYQEWLMFVSYRFYCSFFRFISFCTKLYIPNFLTALFTSIQ